MTRMRCSRSVSLLLVALTVLHPIGAAVAQSTLEDVLYLKNGGVIRGIITEHVLGSGVTIQTAGGNVLVFKEDEILRLAKEPPIQEQPISNNTPQVESVEGPKAKDCDESRAMGRVDAGTRHSSTGWFVGGLACGVLGGLIGTGVITAIAATSGPQPDQVPEAVEAACYIDGYRGKSKGSNTWGAFGGGLLGTLVFVAIYVAATGD